MLLYYLTDNFMTLMILAALFPKEPDPASDHRIFPSDHPCRDEYNQQNGDQNPLRNQESLTRSRLHIGHVIGGKEERDIGRDEDREHTPPSVDPDEGVVGSACKK